MAGLGAVAKAVVAEIQELVAKDGWERRTRVGPMIVSSRPVGIEMEMLITCERCGWRHEESAPLAESVARRNKRIDRAMVKHDAQCSRVN